MGDKPEIMRAENRECSGRQLGDKCEITQTRALRERERRECTGRQVETGGGEWERNVQSCGQRIRVQLGDKWETCAKSCGHRKTTGKQVRNCAGLLLFALLSRPGSTGGGATTY